MLTRAAISVQKASPTCAWMASSPRTTTSPAGRRDQQQHAVAVPRGVQAQAPERALGQASAAADEEAGDRDADLARGPGLGARDGLFHGGGIQPPQERSS